MKLFSSLIAALCVSYASANDPAGSWLSYTQYSADGKTISNVNATWVVPNKPKSSWGSNAPGWWYGIQTAAGNGALVQPILAWGYQGAVYSIFNACFDWTDGSWHTSPETYTVPAGDTITSSVTLLSGDGSANSRSTYRMFIHSAQTGKSITTDYELESGQSSVESMAYFVLEHQPDSCDAYPADGECTFTDVTVEVEGSVVSSPKWVAKQEQPACDSKATVVDPHTLKFTWNPNSSNSGNRAARDAVPAKWGFGSPSRPMGNATQV